MCLNQNDTDSNISISVQLFFKFHRTTKSYDIMYVNQQSVNRLLGSTTITFAIKRNDYGDIPVDVTKLLYGVPGW